MVASSSVSTERRHVTGADLAADLAAGLAVVSVLRGCRKATRLLRTRAS